jgi:hypothetical protein
LEARSFASSPARFFDRSWYAMQHVEPERLARLQLGALQLRFAELRDRIPVLTTMASEQGVSDLGDLDDVANSARQIRPQIAVGLGLGTSSANVFVCSWRSAAMCAIGRPVSTANPTDARFQDLCPPSLAHAAVIWLASTQAAPKRGARFSTKARRASSKSEPACA